MTLALTLTLALTPAQALHPYPARGPRPVAPGPRPSTLDPTQVQFEDVLVAAVTGTVAEGGVGSGAELRYVRCSLPQGVQVQAEAPDAVNGAEAADGADGAVGALGAQADGAAGTMGHLDLNLDLDLDLAYISLSRGHCALPKGVVPAPGSKLTFALARERLSGRRRS